METDPATHSAISGDDAQRIANRGNGGRDDASDVTRQWQGRRVLVIGDIVADEHVTGRPHRIAREAPVLVLEHTGSTLNPGGATNVAANLVALGARVALAGVVGDDQTGRELVIGLRDRGMDVAGVMVDPSRPTTTKTRIWAAGAQQQAQQLVVRLDRLDNRPLDPAVITPLVAYLEHAILETDAIVISDYENGVIHPEIIEACLPVARARGVTVVVDAHGGLARFRGATIFTPNQPEAETELGHSLTGDAGVETGARTLLDRLDAKAILITRGQEGMTLVTRDRPGAFHIAAHTMPAVDPTGAGDTVAATFTLAWLAGADASIAATLANTAASIAVSQAGTIAVTAAELRQTIAARRLPHASTPPPRRP